MKVSSILVSAGLVLPTLLGCGGKEDDDDEGSTIDAASVCEQSCATTASLACPRTSSCVADCRNLIDTSKSMFPDCGPQIEAGAACASTKPVSDWECVSDGTARPKAGVCPDETAALFTCVAG